MKNKKSLFIALGVLFVVVAVIVFVVFSGNNKSEGILIAEETEVIETIEELDETENQLTMADTVLTFSDKGFLKLYDMDTGETVSILDLDKTYFEEIEEINPENVEFDTEQTIEEDAEIKEIENTDTEVEDNEEDVVEEIVEPKKSHSYKYVKNSAGDFDIFYEETTNKLFSVTIEDKVLFSSLLLEDINLSNMNSIWVNQDIAYISYNDSNEITKVTLLDKIKSTITLDGVPSSFAINDNNIYYTFLDKLSKLDMSSQQDITVLLGDISKDVFFVDKDLYVINHFGSGKSNSLLMKVNAENLKVDKIIELKGAKSEIVGVNNENSILYVLQNDEEYNIKSIDIVSMKPLNALKVEKNEKFKALDDGVYYQKDNKLIFRSLMTNEIIKEIEIDGQLAVVK